MAMAVMRDCPNRGMSGTRASPHAIVATLNIAGDSAGTKKWCSAFSMPIATTASTIVSRNGSITRVS